jgi:hypothetical protein
MLVQLHVNLLPAKTYSLALQTKPLLERVFPSQLNRAS